MVLINVGAAVSNINIISRGVTTFTRDITMGGNAFTEEIQKQLNISYDEAEALKVGGQGESDAVVPQEVERVIQGVAEQLGGEIQRSLDFYASTAADGKITRALLSGGTARIPALFKTIEARAGVPVEILNPFKNIEIDNRKFDPAVILAAAPVGGGRRRARAPPSRGQVSHDPDQPTPRPGLEEEGGGQAAARPLRRARRGRLRRATSSGRSRAPAISRRASRRSRRRARRSRSSTGSSAR